MKECCSYSVQCCSYSVHGCVYAYMCLSQHTHTLHMNSREIFTLKMIRVKNFCGVKFSFDLFLMVDAHNYQQGH